MRQNHLENLYLQLVNYQSSPMKEKILKKNRISIEYKQHA